MKGLQRISKIRNLSTKNNTWKHKDLFRVLNYDDIWILAYENLKGNKELSSPGITNDTMNRMSINRLLRLKNKVITESYTFKSVKRVMISQLDGRLRPVGHPTANDKIVQEVIRILLDAIYEPIFSDFNFGFRPGLGYHNALQHVEHNFRWVDYVLEGDIEPAYPSINYQVLIETCLRKRISDERFINLIWKFLKCGIMDEPLFFNTYKDISQGSIVGPILTNIYYHEFDEWVKLLMTEFCHPQSSLKDAPYKRIEHKIFKLTKILAKLDKDSSNYRILAKELRFLRKERLKTPSLVSPKPRIEYVRYADNWIIGIAGDISLAYNIKSRATDFIKHNLDQTLNQNKSRIINIRKGKVEFLDYDIFLSATNFVHKYKKQGGKTVQTTKRVNSILCFDLPQSKVVKKLKEKGYVAVINNSIRPISRASYVYMEDHVIVSHFRSLFIGIENYYSGITRRQRLQYINYLLQMSCAMTLAHKHRSSSSKIFSKYGKDIKVPIPGTNKFCSYPYKTQWRLSDRRWLKGLKGINIF